MQQYSEVSDAESNLDGSVNSAAASKKNKEEQDKESFKFLENKKKLMKESQYRTRFDGLSREISENIINTTVEYGKKIQEKTGWGSMVFYSKMANGGYDINVYPQKVGESNNNQSGVPVSQEPIALSKILIATSVLAGKVPDAQVVGDDKVYNKAAYELWKRTWTLKGGNGQNTLERTYQNLLTYGWAAWRTYPRRVAVKRKGIDKILFDDVYREPMDPDRTWLGIGQNVGDYWSAFEVYYEKDILKDEFFKMVPEAAEHKRKKKYFECSSSEESKDENQLLADNSYTIGYYENVLMNRYIVKCGKFIIYDGELPNDDSYGSILVARCFVKNILDPYGVGLYEMMRGNTALFTYINSLNAQQVEAEIFPLLFGPQVQNGANTYRRSPNVINPKNPGSSIDVVKTSGNVQQGIAFGRDQKLAIEENTGVNNIVAGQNGESTLGATVILKEAAYNRLTPPRNSMMGALQTDAHIALSWIEQTYPVDKVFMVDSDEDVAEFVNQNPDYFVETQQVTGDDNETIVGHVITASRNLRLDFDFTPEGELMEDVPTRTIAARNLFKEMSDYGHDKAYLEFIIDPDSMLVPSMEIQKQNYMAISPVITNQINLIFQLRNNDPEAAASQLRAFERLLFIQKENIYDYIPKSMYDAIISMQPSEIPPPSAEEPIDKTKLYKDAPADVQREIEEQAGLEPSQDNMMAPQTPGTIPPIKRTNPPAGMPGESSDPNLARPKGPEQIARPQSPMGSAVDASMGQAANLPFFPG